MNTGLVITAYLSAALVAGITAGAAAPAKRRHAGYWMILSFLAPPMVFLLLMLPRGRGVHNPADPYLDRDDDDAI